MATTMYGTPMVSNVMPNPTGVPLMSSVMPNPMGVSVVSNVMPNPMTVNANMNLPLSMARPIEVTESTPNLEQIQGFPVAGRLMDGTHFHQDPNTGQMYKMSEEFHMRIPDLLRKNKTETIQQTQTNSTTIDPYLQAYINKFEVNTPSISGFVATAIETPYLSESPASTTETTSMPDLGYQLYETTPIVIENEKYKTFDGSYTQTKIYENGTPIQITDTMQGIVDRINLNVKKYIIDTNTYGSNSESGNTVLTRNVSNPIIYPVNNFSRIQSTNFPSTYIQQNTLTNNFSSLNMSSNTNYTSNTSTGLPTNKFYDK